MAWALGCFAEVLMLVLHSSVSQLETAGVEDASRVLSPGVADSCRGSYCTGRPGRVARWPATVQRESCRRHQDSIVY